MVESSDYKEDFEQRREAVRAAATEGKPFPSFEGEIPEDELEELEKLYRRTCEEFSASSGRNKRIDVVEAAAFAGQPFPSLEGEITQEQLDSLKAYYELAREEILAKKEEIPAKKTAGQPGDDPAELKKLFEETRYELLEEIGRGGFGAVYKGRNDLGGPVAIKVLGPDFKKCILEGQAAARVDSDFIVKIHDHGELANGRMYLVMDLVRGESDDPSLLAYIKPDLKPPPEAKILHWMRDVTEGMVAATAEGITHRDLKPQNILIDINRDGRARIGDFGLARIADNEAPATGSSRKDTDNIDAPKNPSGDSEDHHIGSDAIYKSQTADNHGFTLQYWSPEQVKNPRDATEKSDIFCFGATFYHLATGLLPTGKLTIPEIFMMKRGPIKKIETPQEPRKLNPNIDGDICKLIMRCLENEPADRPGSFKAVREDLRNIPLHGRHRELLRKASRALEEGQLDFAIIYFSKMIGGFDDSAKARYGRGIAFLRSKNYKRARDDFTKAIGLKSDYADAYHHLGITYKRMGDTEKSEANFKKAEELGYTAED